MVNYDHFNILRLCNRPFKTTNEMTEVLIANHNSVVAPDCVTYHLGDFTFNNEIYAKQIISRLNGSHVWIRGNHDKWLFRAGICWTDYLELNICNRFITLGHYPAREWNGFYRGAINLHGHVHGRLIPLPRQWDVGVDNNNFFPVSLKQIDKLIQPKI